jgi:hypothetical protein
VLGWVRRHKAAGRLVRSFLWPRSVLDRLSECHRAVSEYWSIERPQSELTNSVLVGFSVKVFGFLAIRSSREE